MPTENKCELCGKVFSAPSKLKIHQNSKTPCVVVHVDDADLNNPNRCIYCNKVYSDRICLLRHHKICRKKAEHSGDKNTYVNSKNDVESKTMKEMFTMFMKMHAEMMEKLNDKTSQLTNITNNNNNNTINVNNITLNNYMQPEAPEISFSDIRNCRGLHKLLIKEIYFNPNLPSNHGVYPINRSLQNRCMGVYDDGSWRKLTGALIDEALNNMSNNAFKIGCDILRANEKLFYDEYDKAGRPVEFKTRINNFKAREEMATPSEIFEMAIEFSPSMIRPDI